MSNIFKIFAIMIVIFFIIACNNNSVQDIYDGKFIEPPDAKAYPILLKPNNNEIILDSFYLIWTSVKNADSYIVEIYNDEMFWSKESESEQIQVNLSEINATSNKYFWRVTATFAGKRGTPSEVFTINILVSGVIYVSVNSTGSDNGHGLYYDPFKNLDDAVNVSNLIPGVQKIYIAEGSYTANTSVLEDVEIYGGYSRTDWSIRNYKNNKTCIIPQYITAFSLSSSVSRSTIIDGIVFDHLPGYSIDIIISMSSSPVISNNIFYNTVEDSTPIAIIAQNYSHALIENCAFTVMSSSFTGSRPNINSNLADTEIINCTFYGSVNLNGGSSKFESCYSEGNISINSKTKDDFISFRNNQVFNIIRINYYNTGIINLCNNYIRAYLSSNQGVYLYIPNSTTPSSSVSNDNYIVIAGNYIESGTSSFNECLYLTSNNLTSTVSLYVINNTFKIGNYSASPTSSYYCTYFGIYNSSSINVLVANNIFVDLWNTSISIGAIGCGEKLPTICNNVFVGTNFIERTITGYYNYNIDSLNTLTGSVSNTYDYDYNNVFSNINDLVSPYILKNTASCSIDKGYNYQINGTSISDILLKDITLTHSRLSGSSIDIGAYEYQFF